MDNSPFQEDLPIQLDHFPGSQQQEKTTNPPQEVALTHTLILCACICSRGYSHDICESCSYNDYVYDCIYIYINNIDIYT